MSKGVCIKKKSEGKLTKQISHI